jgi:hypothetical protein
LDKLALSQFTFLASNAPIKDVRNPHAKTVSLNEAVALGEEVPDIFGDDYDWDKPDVLLWTDEEFDLEDITIFEAKWFKTYTPGLQYNSIVDWGFSDERAKQLIAYIRKHLETTDTIEIWHIWLDGDNDINGTPEIVSVSCDDLTSDFLACYLKDNHGEDRPVRIIIKSGN